MTDKLGRFHQYSTSHQFRNPLDEIETIAQSSHNVAYYFDEDHETNRNLNRNVMNNNVPTAALIEDFEIVERNETPSLFKNETLVDLTNSEDTYSKNLNSTKKSSDFIVALVEKRIPAIKFDKREGKISQFQVTQLLPGMLVRSMEDDDCKIEFLKKWYDEQKLTYQIPALTKPMQDLNNDLLCTMVTSSDVMRISHNQAMQLLSLTPIERIYLYQDFERFNFVMNLKVGDPVTVYVDEEMKRVPANVTWIGERQNESGIWYNVNFDTESQWPQTSYERLNNRQKKLENNSSLFDMSGLSSVAPSSSRLYYNPNQLHMPIKGGGVTSLFDNRRPVTFNEPSDGRGEYDRDIQMKPRERIIQIKMKENPRSSRSSNQSEQQYEHDYHGEKPSGQSNYQQSQAYHQQNQTQSIPSRSRSVHSIPVVYKRPQAATKNEPVRDDNLGFRVGDPCVWPSKNEKEKGIIKYIGYLKGHDSLYAGVEFKNKIGSGSGMFNKEQLFVAKDGHSGFVELASLEHPPSSSGSSPFSTISSAHRRRLSSSRSQQIPAATGSSICVPVNNRNNQTKQASIESLSDPLPPPYTPPSPPRSLSAAAVPPPLPPKPNHHMEDYLINSFEIGSPVLVCHLGAQRTGIVRYLLDAMNENGNALERSAIIQLDDDIPSAWRRSNEIDSGSPINGGVLVPVSSLRRNRSAQMSVMPSTNQQFSTSQSNRKNEEFGSIDSGIEKQKCLPVKDIQMLVGRQKGIQGYCNSCYLDATLYAMFAQSTSYDFLLEKSMKGNEKGAQFQKLLAQEIVFPLRKMHYVRADHVMKLRRLLADFMPHMTGLTNEEKDPEEILAFIFSEILKVDPFISLNGVNKSIDSQYLVPIVVDNDWQGGAATSQHLLERHMRSAQVKFEKAPPILIMQLPRYGQQKVFDKILPLEKIDITPFVAGATPECSQCGSCADVYCPTCFLTRRVFFTDIVYCDKCFYKSHMLPEMFDHMKRGLFPPGKPPKKPSSHKMILSAVLCIETSHYVAYVRTSTGQWVFFDSMADREGLSDGFNVPVVKECVDMSYWLSLSGWNRLKDADETGQIKAMFGKSTLDPLVGRLLSDSYICFYEDSCTTTTSGSSTLINTFKNIIN